MNGIHFSSVRQEWATPRRFFDALDAEFHFSLDPCALPENATCGRFFTPDDDGLVQPWAPGVVYCNPPYGYSIGKWVRKAYEEAQGGAVVVMLVPSRTETRWWHEYVMRAREVRLLRGRMRFSGSVNPAPFPNAVVVFVAGDWTPVFSAMDRIVDPQRELVTSH